MGSVMSFYCEPPFVADVSDAVAQFLWGAAEVEVGEEVEIALATDAAAGGDVGQGQVGEAQQVCDQALAVDRAELVAGLAGEAADES